MFQLINLSKKYTQITIEIMIHIQHTMSSFSKPVEVIEDTFLTFNLQLLIISMSITLNTLILVEGNVPHKFPLLPHLNGDKKRTKLPISPTNPQRDIPKHHSNWEFAGLKKFSIWDTSRSCYLFIDN